MTQTQFSRALLASVLAIALTGCSSLGGVGDRLSNLNPFSKSGEPDASQGDIPEESERITILSLSDSLEVGSNLGPADVIIPEAYNNTDWAQPGGNPSHVMGVTAAGQNLTRLWKKDIGKGSSKKGRIVATPVIANGVIYTLDADNTVRATRSSDGSKIWDYEITVELGEATRSRETGFKGRLANPRGFFGGGRSGVDRESLGGGVAYDGGRVYVSSGYGVMSALDARTGAKIWDRKTETPLHSAPTISDGRVFAITDDNEIFAFDTSNGEILWTYQGIIETARMLTSPSPAVIDDVVLAPFASGEIVALRAQNGTVLWQDALSSAGKLTPLSSLNDISAGPAVADGYVIATAQSGAMSAFDLRTGQRIWNQPAGALGYPLMAGDFIYTVTTDAQMACLSRADGKVVWLTQLETYEKPKKKKGKISWVGPIFTGGRLFTASSHGQAAEIDPRTGTIIRSYDIGDPIFVQPVIADQTVYLLNDDADLIALR